MTPSRLKPPQLQPSQLHIVDIGAHGSTDTVTLALASLPVGHGLLVCRDKTVPDEAVLTLMCAAADAPLAASVSALEVAGTATVTVVDTPADLPPPTVGSPSMMLVLLLPDALASVPFPAHEPSFDKALTKWAVEATHHGWRHVGAPGLIAPLTSVPLNRLLPIDELNGPANELLATHRLWATTRTTAMRLAIDGACMVPGAEATGTYQVVVELMSQLAATRPGSDIALAVPTQHLATMTQRFSGRKGVRVVARDQSQPNDAGQFHAVYRPYQFIYPDQIAWTFEAAHRTLLGQLDMIGFSNPSYHPTPEAFHAARNMQRATMRRADAVITISRFSADTILAECPDLEPRRVSVVACGTDHVSPVPAIRPLALNPAVKQFIVCLSATFWHKNRPHAIRTFGELRRRGYQGHLVIAGPQPYYGRSTDAEDELLRAFPPSDRDAVHRLPAVDEAGKWWLLESADAVLYPSINEGFGLVPFEAATAGVPALAGHTASLPEVFGDGPVLARSWAAADWADIVEGWLNDPAQAQAQVSALRQRAAQLTWHDAAIQTWAVIDDALARPRRQPTAEEGDRWSSMEAHRLGLTAPARAVRNGRRVAGLARRTVRGLR